MASSGPSLSELLPIWATAVNIIAMVLCFFAGDFVSAATMCYHHELRTSQPTQGDHTYLERTMWRAFNWSLMAVLWIIAMGAQKEYAAVGFALGLTLSLVFGDLSRIVRIFI